MPGDRCLGSEQELHHFQACIGRGQVQRGVAEDVGRCDLGAEAVYSRLEAIGWRPSVAGYLEAIARLEAICEGSSL